MSSSTLPVRTDIQVPAYAPGARTFTLTGRNITGETFRWKVYREEHLGTLEIDITQVAHTTPASGITSIAWTAADLANANAEGITRWWYEGFIIPAAGVEGVDDIPWFEGEFLIYARPE